jgi:hypothetical protein
VIWRHSTNRNTAHERMVLVLGMQKNVIRCGVCARVHDLTALLELQPLGNGTFTFVCPVQKTGGSYRLEQVGTLHTKPAAA